MEVRLDHRWMEMRYAIWFYERSAEGAVIYDADGSVQERLASGEEPGEPSLVIHERTLEALVAAASDHLPPSSAVERHLNDVMGVRDRLLTLIEQKADGA